MADRASQPVPEDLDHARAAADAALQAAVGRGDLGLAEYEERAAEVWHAEDRAALDRLTGGLARPATAPASRGGATQHTVAVLSENVTTGPVGDGSVAATSVLGKATIDLRRTDLPPEVTVRAVAVLGETEVLVPRGAVVHVRGASVLGNRTSAVDAADAGAPVVTVTGTAVLGSVSISHGDAPAVPAASAVSAREPGRAPARRRHGHRPWRRVVAVVAAAAAGYGLVQVAGADHSSVFGSGTVQVTQAGPVDVGMLFGSYEVVVPDGSRVDTSGLVVFGSTECDAACTPGGTGPVISVHATGAFGSVAVRTRTEAAQKVAGRDDRDR